MYGEFILVVKPGQPTAKARRLPMGETAGHNEAWLRDTLLAYPEILPVGDIDPGFGPLIPLCRELRTDAGPLDLAFINPHGRLTLIECKLWKNPEARRKVVAQALDYASAISRWSYSDLQRQVSQATGRHGNVPFDQVRQGHPDIEEARFVDATARSLETGRFLLLIAGDGIREDVESLAEYINRNTAADFTLGLVEVGLYGFADGALAIQPRIIAKTRTIDRMMDLGRGGARATDLVVDSEPDADVPDSRTGGENARQAEYRAWWAPVIAAAFDDPDQEPAKLYWPNNIRAPLPWPQAWVTAYRYGGPGGIVGVGTGGRSGADQAMLEHLRPRMDSILAELPSGFEFRPTSGGDGMTVAIVRPCAQFASDDEMRKWTADMLNSLVNAIRPALKT
jgi:hypothetical protein